MLISVIFVDDEPGGEVCDICKQEIKGRKWEMFLDFGDPQTSVPLDQTYCTRCKIQFEKNDNNRKET